MLSVQQLAALLSEDEEELKVLSVRLNECPPEDRNITKIWVTFLRKEIIKIRKQLQAAAES